MSVVWYAVLKPTHPLSGMITGEAAEVHDDDLVCSLRLPIGLGMERQCHVQLGAREPHELAPEGRREDGVPIRDDGLRKTMEADNLGEERLDHRFRRVGCARRMKWQYLLQRSTTVKMTDFPPT